MKSMFTSEVFNWHSCASRVLQARPDSRKDPCLWSRTQFIWKLPNASSPGSCTQPLAKTGMVLLHSGCLIPQQWAKCSQFFINSVRISAISRNEGLLKVLIFHVRSLSMSLSFRSCLICPSSRVVDGNKLHLYQHGKQKEWPWQFSVVLRVINYACESMTNPLSLRAVIKLSCRIQERRQLQLDKGISSQIFVIFQFIISYRIPICKANAHGVVDPSCRGSQTAVLPWIITVKKEIKLPGNSTKRQTPVKPFRIPD